MKMVPGKYLFVSVRVILQHHFLLTAFKLLKLAKYDSQAECNVFMVSGLIVTFQIVHYSNSQSNSF